jgi:hypothetical protein
MAHVGSSRNRIHRWLLPALLLSAAPPAAAQAPAAPSLSFTAQAVTAEGMTPGGTVIWFGFGREEVEYSAVHSERQETSAADAQGHAVLMAAAGVPQQSAWVAVDLKTGAWAQGSPAGFSPGGYALGGGAFDQGGAAAAGKLLDPTDFIHVLLVRPGQGAWAATIGRGGPKDESSAAEAKLKVSFANLDALVPGVPAPTQLNAKDLLVVAHPRTMEIGILVGG